MNKQVKHISEISEKELAELLYNGEVLSIDNENELLPINESIGNLMPCVDDRLKPAKGNMEKSREIAKELKSKTNFFLSFFKK